MHTDEPDLPHKEQLTYHIYQDETTTSLSLTAAANTLLSYSVASVIALNIHLKSEHKLLMKKRCSLQC